MCMYALLCFVLFTWQAGNRDILFTFTFVLSTSGSRLIYVISTQQWLLRSTTNHFIQILYIHMAGNFDHVIPMNKLYVRLIKCGT